MYAKQKQFSTRSHHNTKVQEQGLPDPLAQAFLPRRREGQASDAWQHLALAGRPDRYHPTTARRRTAGRWRPVGDRSQFAARSCRGRTANDPTDRARQRPGLSAVSPEGRGRGVDRRTHLEAGLQTGHPARATPRDGHHQPVSGTWPPRRHRTGSLRSNRLVAAASETNRKQACQEASPRPNAAIVRRQFELLHGRQAGPGSVRLYTIKYLALESASSSAARSSGSISDTSSSPDD